ncbi:MAG TPA: DUF5709 domain-containing protein [Micromonosporaceae bacterium]|nr:DUF5709 domain-containing protein [Micromonosporaceae bacterium]
MRSDDAYPRPVSDPAAEGIPEYADDDSTAFDDDSPRIADGRDPAALPAEREDGPVAVEDFGTTAEEQRRGEPLAARLIREEPDVTPDGAWPGDAELLDEEPVDPHLGSPVSMYERMGADPVTGGRVGRLVEPDQGAHPDEERDAIATDMGASGGGASAEELAMHEVRDPAEGVDPDSRG